MSSLLRILNAPQTNDNFSQLVSRGKEIEADKAKITYVIAAFQDHSSRRFGIHWRKKLDLATS